MKLLSSLLALAALALAPSAYARTCALSIDSNDRMQFSTTSLAVPGDCTQVELTLRHTGSRPVAVMGHNWVLAQTKDFTAVAQAGMRASLADNYLPRNDARVIAATPMIGGGATTRVRFATSKLNKGGDYTFFCSFPGHWGVMKGKLTFG